MSFADDIAIPANAQSHFHLRRICPAISPHRRGPPIESNGRSAAARMRYGEPHRAKRNIVFPNPRSYQRQWRSYRDHPGDDRDDKSDPVFANRADNCAFDTRRRARSLIFLSARFDCVSLLWYRERSIYLKIAVGSSKGRLGRRIPLSFDRSFRARCGSTGTRDFVLWFTGNYVIGITTLANISRAL